MLVEMSRQENNFNMFRNIGTQRIDGFSRWCLSVYILSSAREIEEHHFENPTRADFVRCGSVLLSLLVDLGLGLIEDYVREG